MSESVEPNVAVELARMNGKLDAALGTHSAKLDEHARRLDKVETDHDKLDDRVRNVEARPVVTPRSMIGGAGVLVAVIAVVVAIIQTVLR